MKFFKKLKIAFALSDNTSALNSMINILDNENTQYVVCRKVNFGVNGNFVRFVPVVDFNETGKTDK